ncbi:MAG: hypothetical protein LBD40_00170 [Puniceicoccales bacterium]|jgi:hypothetical protein|nr:hypothetical protein [Puniceicoccales bacterium]
MVKNFHLFVTNLSKILSISISCSLCCLISHGGILEHWYERCPADAFWQKVFEEKKDLSVSDRQFVEEQRGQIECFRQRLGIPEGNAYYIVCDIVKISSDELIRFNFPQNLFGAERVPCAVKIFSQKDIHWLHPFDQTDDPDAAPSIALPNEFLIRSFDSRDESKNELLDISRLDEGDGFISFIFVPSSVPGGSGDRLLIIRHRIAVSSNIDPQVLHFVWNIDPRLRIKNVHGDGNCGLWAVLEALKHLASQNPSQNYWIFASAPARFNGVVPGEGDYVLMRNLRQKISIFKIKGILEEYAVLTNRRLTDPVMGIDNLFALDPPPQLPQGYGMTNGRSNGRTVQDWKNEEYRNVRSKAEQFSRSIQHIIKFANVQGRASPDVWLNTQDIPYLAPVIDRPIVVIGLQGQRENGPGVYQGIIGADIFLADGSSYLFPVPPGDQASASLEALQAGTSDPLAVRRFIDAHPDTIIIYKMVGAGHFQAIIRKE